VLVGVDAGVDDVVKQVVHDVSETLGTQHAMQGANEHGLLRLQPV